MNKDNSKAGLVCAAYGCKNKSYSCKKSFFRFPTDPMRARRWVIACGREDLLHKLYSLYRGYRLCADHFRYEMFTSTICNRLKHNAVPTIFPALQESTRGFDHTYTRPEKIHLDETPVIPEKCGLKEIVILRNTVTTPDFYRHEILQKTPDPTPTQPNIDLGPESSSKRKREEEFGLTLSDSRESDAQPSTSQTIEEIDRHLKSFISYKQKYKELLDAYKILDQQIFYLKNNTVKNKKSRGTVNVIPSSSTMVMQTKFDHVQISHSQEEIEELGKQWMDEFSHLSADQQVYTKKAISEIFNAAKMNNFHSKSVKISDDCADIVSVKTEHSEVDIFDEHLTSTSKGLGATSVKTEDSGKGIYDDPSTPVNVEFGVNVKTEECELDFDSISETTEESHDVYDENDYRYNQYKTVNLIPDNIDVSVKPEEAELYEESSDMSDNRYLLRTNEDYSVSYLTSNETEIYGDHEDDVIKIEKDEII